MNEKQVHRFVGRYLEATGCSIIEKSPHHYMTKLSPEADRELTNRPYYWSFVDRVGAAPDTMSFLFVTDKQRYDAASESNEAPERKDAPRLGKPALPESGKSAPAQGGNSVDAALQRSFGFVNSTLASAAKVPRDDVYFGSRRLEQLFQASKSKGGFVCLFQEPDKRTGSPYNSTPYTAWLGVNYLVEFASDRKREEIHSFGISLVTGHCIDDFHERLLALKLTPRLPAHIHIAKNGISQSKALAVAEQTLERRLRSYDYSWAEDAVRRLNQELDRISGYYETLLKNATEDNKPAVEEQFRQRQAEIRWQYEPRVTASVINCGIFHLAGID